MASSIFQRINNFDNYTLTAIRKENFKMNMEFFRLINNLANRNTALDKMMIFFSKDMPYIFMAILAIVFLSGIARRNVESRKVVFSTLIITVFNLFLSFIIGNIFYVNRPFVHNKVNLLIPHSQDASFPSDHATGTMSIALGLTKFNKIFGIILTLLSLVVGFSRIYVGNHYPIDVIGAYIIVAITSYVYNLKLRETVENIYVIIEKKLLTKLVSKEFYDEV